MILQLNPPIPVWTKKGNGVAHFLIDYGCHEHHLLWIVAMDDGGQCWAFENPDIRFMANITYGRTKDASATIAQSDRSETRTGAEDTK